MVTAQVGVFPVMGRVALRRLDAQHPVELGADYPARSWLAREVFLMVFTVTRRLEQTTWLEMLLHTAGKSFQGTDEGFDHAANSKSVSGLTSMTPNFQTLSTASCQKFERMSKVASTASMSEAAILLIKNIVSATCNYNVHLRTLEQSRGFGWVLVRMIGL